MGMDPEAILAYGYPLGGAEGEWLIEETGEYGGLDPARIPDWYVESDSFIGQAEKRLLAVIADFTETDWRADGYHDRKRAAEAKVGVEFVHHGGEFSCAMLATWHTSVEWGDTELLDPAELARMPVDGDWDTKLSAAIAALGITPKQARPGWLLAAFYG